jgi:hypothetical protein
MPFTTNLQLAASKEIGGGAAYGRLDLLQFVSVHYNPVIENNKGSRHPSYVKVSIHSEAAPERLGPALGSNI